MWFACFLEAVKSQCCDHDLIYCFIHLLMLIRIGIKAVHRLSKNSLHNNVFLIGLWRDVRICLLQLDMIYEGNKLWPPYYVGKIQMFLTLWLFASPKYALSSKMVPTDLEKCLNLNSVLKSAWFFLELSRVQNCVTDYSACSNRTVPG